MSSKTERRMFVEQAVLVLGGQMAELGRKSSGRGIALDVSLLLHQFCCVFMQNDHSCTYRKRNDEW